MLLLSARSFQFLRLRFGTNAQRNRWFCRVTSVNSEGESISFFAAYLMQSFGFPKLAAIKTAGTLSITTLDNPKAVVAFFKKQGLTDHQVTKVIRSRPAFLSYKAESFKPNIDFLKSKLAEPSEFARVVCTFPALFSYDLNKSLVPSFNFTTSIFGSERDAVRSLRRFGDSVLIDPDSSAARNVKVLLKYGVPRSKLMFLFRNGGLAIRKNPLLFEEVVEEVRKMGFSAESAKFIMALIVRVKLGKESWEKRVNFYKQCGWSEEEFMFAFRCNPYIARFSEKKVTSMFDFFRGMGIKPSQIARNPVVLEMDLEKKIIPRAVVVEALVKKGMHVELLNLQSVFCSSHKVFVKKHCSYEGCDLAKLYKEKLEAASLTSNGS